MSYLYIKKRINFKKIINKYLKKKNLYTKILIINSVKPINKHKNRLLYIYIIKSLHVYSLIHYVKRVKWINKKTIFFKKFEITNFKNFKLKRLKKKKKTSRYKYWGWKNIYKIKHNIVCGVFETPVFKLKKLNTFFLKKKRKQIPNTILNNMRIKLNRLLNNAIKPSVKAFFTLKKKKKNKNCKNVLYFKKKIIYRILNLRKKNKLNLVLQFYKIYSLNTLKKKKKINNLKKTEYFDKNIKYSEESRLMLDFIKIKKVKKKWAKNYLLSIEFQNIHIINKKKQKNILNYIFLNKNSVRSFYVDFYTKTKKVKNILKETFKKQTKKKKVYYFNFWQKKLTTFKRARQIHWDVFKKKTIKKRRYKNFLFFFLKKNKDVIYIFNYFIITFQLSYIFWLDFMSLYIKFYKKTYTKKSIYQLPISTFFWYFLKKHQTKKFKIKKKIKRWIAVKKRIKKRFWMKQKKNIPIFFSKQIYCSKTILNNTQFDYVTNYFCVIKKNTNITLLNKIVNTNRLLKLHNFRYKS